MQALEWSKHAKVVYSLAICLRVAFIIFGEWQDRQLTIQYTDVDYQVISDAAELVVGGHSPYGRATYRYSPLLAYLLVPNVLIHRCWGKLIFSFADLVVGKCIESILVKQGFTEGKSLQYASLWLLNPLSINVSTRGSFDAVTSALVLGTTLLLLGGSTLCAALAYGFVVHLRVYPIIYAPAFALYLARTSIKGLDGTVARGDMKAVAVGLKLLSSKPLLFATVSATTFLACTFGCAWAYGQEFVHGAILYHATRTDNRHNYSIYWYWIYLDYEAQHRWALGLATFLPQAVMLVTSAVLLHGDLALCVFVQTAFFVFFNKVFTGQYLTWYLCLAPLLVPHLAMGKRKVSLLVTGWVCSLLQWLFVAWNLEMKGRSAFLPLWIASVVMFSANIVALNECMRAYYRRG